ncbi:regulator of sirC expression with transglutaminase-like and TPR domain [Breznakibacter xylanolyticus]|uniref:Regulator of sirC expression with transglutaminase-like and TPR domain n=1 Tax=Breznakibacter xylanolyticus TaxID=990 RepID=A0A2W7MXM7_9BACT|nr:transglutaminase-like domain-containing protein [Breznakibacter xylanolyticus]MBN2743805.1 transglutaminase family protein [Marinilabiliaceae bacterium]PZX10927.1 regulator of sirC expression with transglutaminase-like and TPR domain [Breznakibacter xylanolyticus]
MELSRIQALITLLDDPNDEVFMQVESELLRQTIDVIPHLEAAWERSRMELFQSRLENIIHQLQFRYVKFELARWIDSGADDLLYGAYLISRYQFPSLQYSWVENQVNEIRKDIWFELSEHLSALEKVKAINHIMFDVYKFTRNNINIMAAENNYISEVLLTKKGNPVALSVIYVVVCQRLGLPVYGVNLPKNFIVAYLDSGELASRAITEGDVLFYVNPVNKGAVLGRKEIEFFLKQQKIQPQTSYFLPCKSNEEIVKRMLNNLIFAYETNNELQKVREISELMSLFSNFY